MDKNTKFDDLTRSFASTTTRRRALKGFAAGIAALFVGRHSVAAEGENSEDFLGVTDAGCHLLDKIGTFPEDSGGNRNRIEIGGGSWQHVDFYPMPGVPAVSYLVGPREVPAIWWGFGSIWEMRMGCDPSAFDWVRDAEGYITGNDGRDVMRLDQNHSGVVVDLRGDQPEYHNFGKFSDAERDALIKLHLCMLRSSSATVDSCGGWDGPENGTGASGNGSSGGSSTGGDGDQGGTKCTEGYTCPDDESGGGSGEEPGGPVEGDCKPKTEQHDPADGLWSVTGPAYLQFWSNAPGVDQAEHKVLIESGLYSLNGGGTGHFYGSGCLEAARAKFEADNSRQAWTLDDLRGMGLVS